MIEAARCQAQSRTGNGDDEIAFFEKRPAAPVHEAGEDGGQILAAMMFPGENQPRRAAVVVKRADGLSPGRRLGEAVFAQPPPASRTARGSEVVVGKTFPGHTLRGSMWRSGGEQRTMGARPPAHGAMAGCGLGWRFFRSGESRDASAVFPAMRLSGSGCRSMGGRAERGDGRDRARAAGADAFVEPGKRCKTVPAKAVGRSVAPVFPEGGFADRAERRHEEGPHAQRKAPQQPGDGTARGGAEGCRFAHAPSSFDHAGLIGVGEWRKTRLPCRPWPVCGGRADQIRADRDRIRITVRDRIAAGKAGPRVNGSCACRRAASPWQGKGETGLRVNPSCAGFVSCPICVLSRSRVPCARAYIASSPRNGAGTALERFLPGRPDLGTCRKMARNASHATRCSGAFAQSRLALVLRSPAAGRGCWPHEPAWPELVRLPCPLVISDVISNQATRPAALPVRPRPRSSARSQLRTRPTHDPHRSAQAFAERSNYGAVGPHQASAGRSSRCERALAGMPRRTGLFGAYGAVLLSDDAQTGSIAPPFRYLSVSSMGAEDLPLLSRAAFCHESLSGPT